MVNNSKCKHVVGGIFYLFFFCKEKRKKRAKKRSRQFPLIVPDDAILLQFSYNTILCAGNIL